MEKQLEIDDVLREFVSPAMVLTLLSALRWGLSENRIDAVLAGVKYDVLKMWEDETRFYNRPPWGESNDPVNPDTDSY